MEHADVPALTNVSQTEDDFLFNIVQGGYYGHPNPTRGEYVLDGGNPTSGTDSRSSPQYPVGTQPDPNYRGAAYDFGQHHSPDGVIEYQGNAFGGALDGKLLVVRYSGGDDVMVLTPDAQAEHHPGRGRHRRPDRLRQPGGPHRGHRPPASSTSPSTGRRS